MESNLAVKFSFLIPLLPLIGACISGFFGARWLKQNSHWPIWIGVGLSAIISFALLFGMMGQWGTGPELKTGVESKAEAAEEAREGGTHGATVHEKEGYRTLSTTNIWYTWGRFGDPSKAGTKEF